LRKFRLEKGVFLALLATLGMGTANFLYGVGARSTSPLLINWFTSTVIALTMVGYLAYTHQWKAVRKDWRKYKKLIIGVSIIDNMAWFKYGHDPDCNRDGY
jgi:uncharacterized membrane protein